MTAPKDLPYTIVGRELVGQVEGMRVQILSLAPGETVPWHYHTIVCDIFVCVEGTTIVTTRAPDGEETRRVLAPGEHFMVTAPMPHEVSEAGEGCRFSLTQGVGEHDYFPA